MTYCCYCSRRIRNGARWCYWCDKATLSRYAYEGSGSPVVAAHGPYPAIDGGATRRAEKVGRAVSRERTDLKLILRERRLPLNAVAAKMGIPQRAAYSILLGEMREPADFEERFRAAVEQVAAEKAARLLGEPAGVASR
jgi:mevalonate pyrophosphate decarboxylase